jgi:predicted transcriptional regulator
MKKNLFNLTSIKQYFRARCEEVGITMKDLYDMTDIHRSTIQRCFSGKTSPSWATLQKLEYALNEYEVVKNSPEFRF